MNFSIIAKVHIGGFFIPLNNSDLKSRQMQTRLLIR